MDLFKNEEKKKVLLFFFLFFNFWIVLFRIFKCKSWESNISIGCENVLITNINDFSCQIIHQAPLSLAYMV